MNKKAILIGIIFLLFVSNAYAVSFSYVPRMTLYGNATDALGASITIQNPMNNTIDVNVTHEGQSDVQFNDSTEFTMLSNETRIVNFMVYPKVGGTREEYIDFTVTDNNMAGGVFQTAMVLVIGNSTENNTIPENNPAPTPVSQPGYSGGYSGGYYGGSIIPTNNTNNTKPATNNTPLTIPANTSNTTPTTSNTTITNTSTAQPIETTGAGTTDVQQPTQGIPLYMIIIAGMTVIIIGIGSFILVRNRKKTKPKETPKEPQEVKP
jgi:hypothetical protein